MNRILCLFLLLATASIRLEAQTPYTADANTLFLYHFDEGDNQARLLSDSSGNSRDAVYGSAATAGLESLQGLGLAVATAGKLEGRITWRDTAEPHDTNSLLYKLPAEDFTFEAWVKPGPEFANFTSGSRYLAVIQPDGIPYVDFSICVHAADGKYYLAIGDKDGPHRSWTYTAPLDWKIGEWYHVAVTGEQIAPNSFRYTFYNTKAGDASTSPDAIYSTVGTALEPQSTYTELRTLEIGNYYGNNGDSLFPGLIDEVRISNVARTEFETLAP